MFLFEISKEYKEFLATIRQWSTIKIAFTETSIWLKDFTDEQMKSASLLQIPHLIKYREKENLLFLNDSLLPSKKMPSALLWSPIQKALPVELPSLNHNFFGVQQQIDVRIVPSEIEREAMAMLTSIQNLQDYLEQSPDVRLKPLKWMILEDKALVLGTPLLPIKGVVFWQMGNALLPIGFDFELPILKNIIDKKVNFNSENWILWQSDNSYVSLPKENVQPLSIGSLRLTL
jgi:MoxR-vWA-beta-propeller ternary system domain bpX2